MIKSISVGGGGSKGGRQRKENKLIAATKSQTLGRKTCKDNF